MVRIEWGAEGRGWQVFGAAGMESMATIILLKKASVIQSGFSKRLYIRNMESVSVEVDCRAAIDWFG